MEAKIQYFQSPIFGEIRVTVIENKPMFVASDVAAMLGYSNRYDAINRHCKGMFCPDCRNIVPLVVGGVIGDAAPSFNSLVGRLQWE